MELGSRLLPIIVFIVCASLRAAEMRPIQQLEVGEDGWTDVLRFIKAATNKVEVLPCDETQAREALYRTQVTTRSPLGAIIRRTGGLLVGDGRVRILGSGSERLKRSVPEWNRGKSFAEFGERPSFVLVADDPFGGFFAINGGGISPSDAGAVFYLSPRTLQWERIARSYTEFLISIFGADLDLFYEDMKWPDASTVLSKVRGDEALSFHPPPFTEQGRDLARASINIGAIEEIWALNTQAIQAFSKGTAEPGTSENAAKE